MTAEMRSTCWNLDGFTTLTAETPAEADEKTNFESLLIIKGTARAVGARSVETLARGSNFFHAKDMIKKGDICTIEISSLLRIANSVYKGRIKIGVTADKFLAFSKKGIFFWVILQEVQFITINGRRL